MRIVVLHIRNQGHGPSVSDILSIKNRCYNAQRTWTRLVIRSFSQGVLRPYTSMTLWQKPPGGLSCLEMTGHRRDTSHLQASVSMAKRRRQALIGAFRAKLTTTCPRPASLPISSTPSSAAGAHGQVSDFSRGDLDPSAEGQLFTLWIVGEDGSPFVVHAGIGRRTGGPVYCRRVFLWVIRACAQWIANRSFAWTACDSCGWAGAIGRKRGGRVCTNHTPDRVDGQTTGQSQIHHLGDAGLLRVSRGTPRRWTSQVPLGPLGGIWRHSQP